MRQSNHTGQSIRDYINSLEKEVETVKDAMGGVAAQMGEEAPAYNILLGNLAEAESKLNKVLETKYTVVGR